jgi:hypothetical protein
MVAYDRPGTYGGFLQALKTKTRKIPISCTERKEGPAEALIFGPLTSPEGIASRCPVLSTPSTSKKSTACDFSSDRVQMQGSLYVGKALGVVAV